MNPSLKERACCPNPPFRGANRLAAAVLAGCQDGRCVWTHDLAPTHRSVSLLLGRCIGRIAVPGHRPVRSSLARQQQDCTGSTPPSRKRQGFRRLESW